MEPIHVLLCTLAIGLSAGSVTRVKIGEDIDFQIPSYSDCGQYTLLDSHLKPVVIIEGRQLPNLVGEYADRSTIDVTDYGYNLTISNATFMDSGAFQLTAANGQTAKCTDSSFEVVIHNISTPDGSYFEAWSAWSTCERACDRDLLQFRTRSCSMVDGCDGLGENKQNRTCDLEDSCPRWSEWGGWSNCSAMCGKGFKIRKRICVNGESALLKSSDCVGQSTQSHLCMTVCEVVGYWDMWSKWGDCSSDCAGGTRNRTRQCTRDSRATNTRCNGDSLQTESCNENPCTSTESTSTNLPTLKEADVEDEPLDVAVLVIVLCIAAIIIILIPILLLRKHRANNKAVDAIAVDRRAGGGRRKHKTSSTASDGAPQQCQTGINVYSELNSSFVYSSSEFDSVFIDDNGANSVHIPKLENIAEEGEEHDNDAVVDAECSAQPASENIANEIEETIEPTQDTSANQSVYFEPPDESKSQSFEIENKINEIINSNVETCDDDDESVYYEPPENSSTNSRKISTLSIKTEKSVSFENERKESVYENISNVERSHENEDECYDSVYGSRTCDYPETFTSTFEQSEAVREKEREAYNYNDDHIYVNATDIQVIEFSAPVDEKLGDHIYDIPKNKEI